MLRGAAWCCVVLRGAAWCCVFGVPGVVGGEDEVLVAVGVALEFPLLHQVTGIGLLVHCQQVSR